MAKKKKKNKKEKHSAGFGKGLFLILVGLIFYGISFYKFTTTTKYTLCIALISVTCLSWLVGVILMLKKNKVK